MERDEAAEAYAIALLLAPHVERVRVLPDNSVAYLHRLMFTTALHLGCTRDSWATRFCFEDYALARQRFDELMSEEDEPHGYIARRGG